MPFIIDARNMGGGSIGSAAGGDTSTGTRNNVTLAAPWDENKEYLKGDLATNNGDLYQAQKSVPAGVQISDEDYWALVVAGDKSKETEQLRKDIGSLAELETESKDNLVDAINEVNRIQPVITKLSADKMDKTNPTGTGSFSMNRKAGTVIGDYSHAEGSTTTASGYSSHAEGLYTTASGDYSHAEGRRTKASGKYSHAQGKFNIEDTSNIYADIIGNGTSDTARSNATTVDWNGNAWFAGDVYTGSTSGTNKDDGSKKLATEEYVNNSIAASGTDISLGLTSAAVGQIIKVKAVDESGKPTAWEAANMPTGEEDFELIFSDTITEDANGFVRTVDKDGNTFELKEAVVIVYTVPFESSTSNVGRAVGFLPSASWGHNLAAGISNSIPAGTSSIARYDVIHVKVVQGYQCLINRWESQNTTNVRGIMMRNNTAGQVPINFKFGDDVTAIGELSNTKGNMTCLKIVSHGTCMAKGDVVILYGKRV